MRALNSRWPLLAAAVATGALVTVSTPSAGGAEAAPALAERVAALGRSESAILLELYAAESALARARSDAAALTERSALLEQNERSLAARTEIVRRSLKASQARVAMLLRALYIQGEPDPISVILGATSLEEAVAGIEGLSRATAQNRRLSVEATAHARKLVGLKTQLAEERTNLTRAENAARASVAHLEAAVAGRSATVAAVRRARSLTTTRLAALEAQAQAAERRSARIASTAATQTTTEAASAQSASEDAPVPEAAAPSASPMQGTRTLVADAVAYHLPGRTASGLPVGVGVIAVDPSVIPLGTRVFVPGYGPAVAADVGTAIKGNIIDLWMPSTAQARAWGRRTVTITIYG
ncbi:3D domain-containing protein [Gaiella sp.]|uniref:3D domain-containing protein n=1 Tax=Gaiella sp. TaxID=2663207 RepID=UPI0032663EAD